VSSRANVRFPPIADISGPRHDAPNCWGSSWPTKRYRLDLSRRILLNRPHPSPPIGRQAFGRYQWMALVTWGVGDDGSLYWDGKPIQVAKRFDLSLGQKVGAVLTVCAALAAAAGSVASVVIDWQSSKCQTSSTSGLRPHP
jgi:hypothetical protein